MEDTLDLQFILLLMEDTLQFKGPQMFIFIISEERTTSFSMYPFIRWVPTISMLTRVIQNFILEDYDVLSWDGSGGVLSEQGSYTGRKK